MSIRLDTTGWARWSTSCVRNSNLTVPTNGICTTQFLFWRMTHKLLWDFDIHLISTWRPDLIIVVSSRGLPEGSPFYSYYTKVWGRALLHCLDCFTLLLILILQYWVLSKAASSTIFWVFGMTQPGTELRSPGGKIVNFAVSADHRKKKKLKESEKKDKYLDLSGEKEKLWNMKVTNLSIVTIEGLLKRLEVLEIREQVKTIQTATLLRTDRILRRVLETWGDLLSLNLQWKTIG